MEFSLNNEFRLSVEAHNKLVEKNRNILNHLIKAACFGGNQEFAFYVRNDSHNSLNRENYIEVLQE